MHTQNCSGRKFIPDVDVAMRKLITAYCNKNKHSDRRKYCALAVVRQSQIFLPRRRPPSQGRGTAKI